MSTIVLTRSDHSVANGASRVTLTVGIVLALWLEISVSIILYCGEVVALLIHKGAVAPAAEAVAPPGPRPPPLAASGPP